MNKVYVYLLIILIPSVVAVDIQEGVVKLTNTGNGTIQVNGGNPYTLTINPGESIDYTYNTSVETWFTVSDNFNKACFSMDCNTLDDNRNTELDINDPYYFDVYPNEIVFFFNEV